VESFHGYNADKIYSAAKIGLGNAGFSLRNSNKSKGVVIGEHGMTTHDWNIIAAVYFLEEDETTKVKIIAEGSKDIGLSSDVTQTVGMVVFSKNVFKQSPPCISQRILTPSNALNFISLTLYFLVLIAPI
jgi:hypothetical protein